MSLTFTSRDVAQLTGISLRQLQWRDERGIVAPPRDGHKRMYSIDDFGNIAMISELRERSFSLQYVWGIFLQDSARDVADVLKNSRQPLLTLCLTDTVRRIAAGIKVAKKQVASERYLYAQRRKAS